MCVRCGTLGFIIHSIKDKALNFSQHLTLHASRFPEFRHGAGSQFSQITSCPAADTFQPVILHCLAQIRYIFRSVNTDSITWWLVLAAECLATFHYQNLKFHLKLGRASLIAIEIHFHSRRKRFTPISLFFLLFFPFFGTRSHADVNGRLISVN